MDLAKFYASKPESKSVKSSLWIKIAKTKMKQEKEINILLTENKKDLTIEDLIPYFDENIQIGTFKKQILESLTKYNDEIDKFKVRAADQTNMQVYVENADFLKKENTELRSKYYILDQEKKCDNCGTAVTKDVFYLFPCGHAFLKKCLKELIKREGLEERHRKLEYFENAIKDLLKKAENRTAGRPEGGSARTTSLRRHGELSQEESHLIEEYSVGRCDPGQTRTAADGRVSILRT